MRKLIFCVFAMLGGICSNAQELGLGLRDNQYFRANYIGQISNSEKHHYILGFEQSLLNVKMQEQSGRFFAGYLFENSSWTVTGIAYGGEEYAGDWYVTGAWLNAHYIWNRLELGATINPNYDSKLDFQLNCDVEAAVAVWKKTYGQIEKQRLDFCCSFGNLPEYRDNLKNLRVGLRFTNGQLWVLPEICVPGVGDKDNASNKIRVLCSMGWRLEFFNFK